MRLVSGRATRLASAVAVVAVVVVVARPWIELLWAPPWMELMMRLPPPLPSPSP